MLTVSYLPEDQWHGELLAEARHAGFAGRAFGWFSTDDLQNFVAPLQIWPSALETPLTLKSGIFSDSTTSSAPVETSIGITINRHGRRGYCLVEAELSDPDEQILPQTAVIRFLAEPSELHRFADAVHAMLGSGGSATLCAADCDTAAAI